MNRAQLFLIGTGLLGLFLITGAAPVGAAPVELGKVNWGRDYEAALSASGESGKPVLILFQEVPG